MKAIRTGGGMRVRGVGGVLPRRAIRCGTRPARQGDGRPRRRRGPQGRRQPHHRDPRADEDRQHDQQDDGEEERQRGQVARATSRAASPGASRTRSTTCPAPTCRATSDNKFDGKADYGTERTFSDQITVVVEDVLPNGNLVVLGKREREVAGDKQSRAGGGHRPPERHRLRQHDPQREGGQLPDHLQDEGQENSYTTPGWLSRLTEPAEPELTSPDRPDHEVTAEESTRQDYHDPDCGLPMQRGRGGRSGDRAYGFPPREMVTVPILLAGLALRSPLATAGSGPGRADQGHRGHPRRPGEPAVGVRPGGGAQRHGRQLARQPPRPDQHPPPLGPGPEPGRPDEQEHRQRDRDGGTAALRPQRLARST